MHEFQGFCPGAYRQYAPCELVTSEFLNGCLTDRKGFASFSYHFIQNKDAKGPYNTNESTKNINAYGYYECKEDVLDINFNDSLFCNRIPFQENEISLGINGHLYQLPPIQYYVN